LLGGPVGASFRDVKLARNGEATSEFREWTRSVRSGGSPLERRLLGALLAEGAVDGNGAGKPSHLHFAAGQQQFLDIAREVLVAVEADPGRLQEALFGPWRYDSDAKNLSWSAGSERIYAVRGFNPSADKRLGVPGADALAFLGLAFFPVAARGTSLITTGCEAAWKVSSLTWPLWSDPLDIDVVRSVIGLDLGHSNRFSHAGLVNVLQSPIRRTDQGGYGSFGAASSLL
jgi:hypothetical protein